MRTRSDAVCADTQAVVSLTTFLSPPSTCRPTNAAQLRQKSAGNGLGTECWAQGSASWGKGQGRKWREGERKTALAHAGGQACPQGGSSALGVALQQGQPNTPCSPLPLVLHCLAGATDRSGSWGGQTQRSACFTWHSPCHLLMLCAAFAEAAAATEAALTHKQETSTGPFTENICPHWLQTPFQPCCVSAGPTSISWGPELSGGHRTEPEVTGSTSGYLSA